MAVQYSTTVRDAVANQVETTIGTAPALELWSGAIPANCAAANSGTLLWTETLPSDWMAASSGGTKAKLGTWTAPGLAAAGAGTVAVHFRIRNGGTVHAQGTVGLTGSGADLIMDNTNIADGQDATVDTFTITAGGA